MTLQKLRFLIAVAESGSINAAAQRLYTAQSNISNAVKSLEQELHIEIFTRSSRGVALTNDGTELLGYARQVVEQADMLEARDLSPERWEEALNLYRRRLKRRARRNAMRGSDLDYFENEPLGPREGSVIVWAGMRGAITLAAAQTIPTHAPMRALLLTIALFIAAGALVIQGLTLPGLIRLVKPKMATGDISEEERAKPLKVMGSALVDTALAQAIHEVDGKTLLSAGVSRTLSRLGHALTDEALGEQVRTAHAVDRVLTDILQDAAGDSDDDGHGTVDMSEEEVERSFTRDQIRELALEAIHAQRDALLQARDEGIFSSAALEGALARLDNEEILLVSSSGVGH